MAFCMEKKSNSRFFVILDLLRWGVSINCVMKKLGCLLKKEAERGKNGSEIHHPIIYEQSHNRPNLLYR